MPGQAAMTIPTADLDRLEALAARLAEDAADCLLQTGDQACIDHEVFLSPDTILRLIAAARDSAGLDQLHDLLARLDGWTANPDTRYEKADEMVAAARRDLRAALPSEPESTGLDVEWWTEYAVHPSQIEDDDWVRLLCQDEADGREWLGRWERGGVVIAARVVRKDRTVVAEWVVPTAPQDDPT